MSHEPLPTATPRPGQSTDSPTDPASEGNPVTPPNPVEGDPQDEQGVRP